MKDGVSLSISSLIDLQLNYAFEPMIITVFGSYINQMREKQERKLTHIIGLTFAAEFVVVLKAVRLTRLRNSCYPQSEGKAASNIYIISTTMAQRAELSPCGMTEGLCYRCRMAVTLPSHFWESERKHC